MNGDPASTDRPAAEAIFNAALELKAEERSAYLAQVCDGNASLRERVGALLRAHDASTRFLPEAPAAVSFDALSATRIVGDYELLEEIARGGMGVVYRARQRNLDRIVAVKMILAGQFASREQALRFRAEAEAAARLQHPNIVRIHETGEHEGRPYFSMDYVEGPNLGALVHEKPLPARRAAIYVRTIAEAIHYAHEQGVLHRDLKPSNILIDSNDQPRITDFGLAKRVTKESFLTVTGEVMGSPGFMPPEQAGAKLGKTGRPSDVYALGGILFYLVTGRAPFVAETVAETLQQVLNAEPISPRLLNASVPQDLATICLKCLEKEPKRRYSSARELADDLERWLRGEPILARSVTQWERAVKWTRRKPAIAALTALLMISTISGLVAVMWQWSKAVTAREEAARRAAAEGQAREHANQALALVEIQRAEELFAAQDNSTALARVAHVLRQNLTNEIVAARAFSNLTRHVLVIPLAELIQHQGAVYFAQFSPDGRRVVTASGDGTAQIWDADTGRPSTPRLQHTGPVNFAQFSSDGLRVVTASEDKTARIWDASTGQPLTSPLQHPRSVGWVYFSSDGGRIVTSAYDRSVRVWDADSGMPLAPPIRGVSFLRCTPFSPDGQKLVLQDGTNVWIRDAKTGSKLVGPITHDRSVLSTEFSPDGQKILTASADGTIRIWDAPAGKPLTQPLNNGRSLWLAHFSADGLSVVTVCQDATIQIWGASTGRPVTGPLPFVAPLESGSASKYYSHSGNWFNTKAAQFSPDGQMVVTKIGGVAQLLDASTGRQLTEPLRQYGITSAEFSRDSERVVTASVLGTARIWRIRNSRQWAAASRNYTNKVRAGFAPVPAWVPELLEALAEKRVSDKGVAEPDPSAQTEIDAVKNAAAEELIPLIMMKDVPLTAAIKNLAEQASLNYTLDPKVTAGLPGPDGKQVPQPKISVHLKNLTGRQAFAALLTNCNLVMVTDPKTQIARITVKEPAAIVPAVSMSNQAEFANPENIAAIAHSNLVETIRKLRRDAASDLQSFRQQVSGSPEPDLWTMWGKWLFAASTNASAPLRKVSK